MGKPKLQIIVLFQNLENEKPYYARSPAPPLSGILVAGLTPPSLEVEVLHEMVRPIDYETDADFIALSFMDFCAPHAIRVARRFRELGKTVIAGGRYPSTFPGQVLPHFDAVVSGEAERVWPRVVGDLLAGRLERLYEAPVAPPLVDIPPPRYDLVEPEFAIPIVTEATRGCPFRCTFCQLNIRPTSHRCRPIPDVLADLATTEGVSWRKRRMAMLYDNNLGGDLAYAKALLREIGRRNLWGLGVQFSFNCLRDREFVDLLEEANCTMAFIGLESLHQPSLGSVEKRQNRVEEYRERFRELKERGILTFTGMMLALDEDTQEYYEELPARLEEVDPSAILTSISIPIPGTPFHAEVAAEGRLIDTNLAHYDGDHLVFRPRKVSAPQVFAAAERVNRVFYSWPAIWRRWRRLLAAYLGRGSVAPGRRAFRALLLTFVLLKLSLFQRHHARERVYGKAARSTTGRGGALPEGASAEGEGRRRACA